MSHLSRLLSTRQARDFSPAEFCLVQYLGTQHATMEACQERLEPSLSSSLVSIPVTCEFLNSSEARCLAVCE